LKWLKIETGDQLIMELTKAGTSDVLVINSISKRAFDSDIVVGASSKGGLILFVEGIERIFSDAKEIKSQLIGCLINNHEEKRCLFV